MLVVMSKPLLVGPEPPLRAARMPALVFLRVHEVMLLPVVMVSLGLRRESLVAARVATGIWESKRVLSHVHFQRGPVTIGASTLGTLEDPLAYSMLLVNMSGEN